MHQCAPKTALRCHKIGASGAFCEQRYWWQKYEDSFCSLFRRKRASKLGIWLETVASGNTFLRYEQDSRDSILTYKGWRSCILRSDRLRPLARSLSWDPGTKGHSSVKGIESFEIRYWRVITGLDRYSNDTDGTGIARELKILRKHPSKLEEANSKI